MSDPGDFDFSTLPNYPWAGCLSSNLRRVCADWAGCLAEADRSIAKLLGDISREWRVMAKDVRFALYGGVDSPERAAAYTDRRLAEYRRSLTPHLHQPRFVALVEAIDALTVPQ